MKAREFFDLVARMRDKQNEYYRTRSTPSLTESRNLERAVDAEIKRVREVLATQQQGKLPLI